MTVLIIGVVLFFGVHLVPSMRLKADIVGRVGEGTYKLGFSVITLTGLGLIVYGFQLSEFVPLWDPLPWARTATYWVMPVALILVSAADVPNNIKRYVRHPMLIGIAMWGGVHLAANGDLASTILFSSFGLFSILDIFLVESSGRYKPRESVHRGWDLGVVIGALALCGVLFYFHEYITGVPLI